MGIDSGVCGFVHIHFGVAAYARFARRVSWPVRGGSSRTAAGARRGDRVADMGAVGGSGVVAWLVGRAAALVGQFVGVQGWVLTHEIWHREHARGPRIVKALNRIVGRWRNHLALWVTLVALPTLWAVRFTELVAYPMLVVLLNFPRYRQRDWINISRHKITGLVGHDLLWCLYCDWMTGVYSLAGEMLRNVESFWCPIRFRDPAKCANCQTDFPDVAHGWAPADTTMTQVTQLIHQKYESGQRSWFGHPARLTIEGELPAQGTTPSEAQSQRDVQQERS